MVRKTVSLTPPHGVNTSRTGVITERWQSKGWGFCSLEAKAIMLGKGSLPWKGALGFVDGKVFHKSSYLLEK